MNNDEMPEIDRRLQEAYARQRTDTAGVEIAIRREIARQIRTRWAQWSAAAVILMAGALGGYWAMRPKPEPKIFASAALDHRIEVVDRAPRRWRTTDADLDILTARFGLNRERIGFPGYRLMRAKVCLLDGQRVLHLVYDDGRAEYSLYLAPQAGSVPVSEAQHGAEHVSGFHGKQLDGLVVGDATVSDCRRFVRTVTGA